MKPVDVKPSIYIELIRKIIRKVLNIKLVVMLEYQNIKIFLQKAMFQIGLKKCLLLQKLKKTVLWAYVISGLNGEEISGTFYKKEFQINKFRV